MFDQTIQGLPVLPDKKFKILKIYNVKFALAVFFISGYTLADWPDTWDNQEIALEHGINVEQYEQFPARFDQFTAEAMDAYGEYFEGWVCEENNDTGGEDCEVIYDIGFEDPEYAGMAFRYGGYHISLFYTPIDTYGSAFLRR